MKLRRLQVIAAPLLLALASCGGGGAPAAPSTAAPAVVLTAPAPAAVASTAGRVVDALTDAAAASITIAGNGVVPTMSDASGRFNVGITSAIAAPQVGFSGSGFVARTTSVRVPGPDATVSLIPSSFDVTAFNEMFRVSQLLRWTEAPALTIQTRTLQFTGTNDADFTALADQMTEGEYAQLVADLTWGLPQLTGGQFTAFASITRETADVGGRVHILNPGRITVARYVGLTTATSFWGYSRWFLRNDGAITSGESMLDRDFERSGSPFLRSLRTHELGHSLGCNHVTVRSSVMNSAARLEPNDFDRGASRIAFQRPPGNRAPDTDPDAFSANRLRSGGEWSAGVP